MVRLGPPIKVFCEVDIVGDDVWTVVLRRDVEGNVSFNRNFEEYKKGFGDFNGDFFLGLENLHQLVKNYFKRSEMKLTTYDSFDTPRIELYKYFELLGEEDDYQI